MNTFCAKIVKCNFLSDGLSEQPVHDLFSTFKDSLQNELQWLIMGKAQMYVCMKADRTSIQVNVGVHFLQASTGLELIVDLPEKTQYINMDSGVRTACGSIVSW